MRWATGADGPKAGTRRKGTPEGAIAGGRREGAARTRGSWPSQPVNGSGEKAGSLALDEAVRVLKPGGRLMVVDLAWVGDYARHLAALGLSDISQRSLGWRVWYGPFVGARLVTGTRSNNHVEDMR